MTGDYLVLTTQQQRFLEGERSKQLGVTFLKEGNTPILYGRPATATLQGTWSGGVFKGARYGPGEALAHLGRRGRSRIEPHGSHDQTRQPARQEPLQLCHGLRRTGQDDPLTGPLGHERTEHAARVAHDRQTRVPQVNAATGNAGSAQLSAAVADYAALTESDYRVDYDVQPSFILGRYSAAELTTTGVEPVEQILERDRTQPELTLDLEAYLKRRLTRDTIRTAPIEVGCAP